MKNKLMLIAGLLAAASGPLAAQSSSYSVTMDFPFVSKYVFRGTQVAKTSFQPSVEVSVADFYAGIWMNSPVVNPHDATGAAKKEIDVYTGYNIKLSDTLKADLGLTWFYYPQANRHVTHSYTTEASAGLNWTLGGLTPSVYGYYDFTLQTWSFQGSVGYSIPLKDLGSSLDLSATLGVVSPDHSPNYTYGSVSATVPFKLSETGKFNVGVAYTGNNLAGAKDPGFWFTAGLTVGF